MKLFWLNFASLFEYSNWHNNYMKKIHIILLVLVAAAIAVLISFFKDGNHL